MMLLRIVWKEHKAQKFVRCFTLIVLSKKSSWTSIEKLVQSKIIVEVYCMIPYFDCMNARIPSFEEVWNNHALKNLYDTKELNKL